MAALAPRRPLAPVKGASGRAIGWVTARADGSPDPLLASVILAFAAREAQAEAHRQAVSQGLAPVPEPLTTWQISDRH